MGLYACHVRVNVEGSKFPRLGGGWSVQDAETPLEAAGMACQRASVGELRAGVRVRVLELGEEHPEFVGRYETDAGTHDPWDESARVVITAAA